MDIVLYTNAMDFGPDTLKYRALGGSETAVLMAAKELKKKGNTVTVFTPLPPQGREDHVESGIIGEDGVRYVDANLYANYVSNTDVDLLIVCRDPRGMATTNYAKKRVLWMHDIATHRGMQMALDQMGWCFDEIWTVSEFHRQQVHETTGYPLKNIVALRNGIVPVEVVRPPFRLDKVLAYASRPERGLANLVRPEGIMENLPEYILHTSMYPNFSDEMKEFYGWCGMRMDELDNVNQPNEFTQQDMRQWLADVQAYIYPTQFEETSCILARECIEQGTPMLTTKTGALPETMGDCALYFEDWLNYMQIAEPTKGGSGWCKLFAEFVKDTLETEAGQYRVEMSIKNMSERHDLYWNGVADMMIEHAEAAPVTRFSRAWSLVQDGDVIPARALLTEIPRDNLDWACSRLLMEIENFYPFLLPKNNPHHESLVSYYKRFYEFKDHELNINQNAIDSALASPRIGMMSEQIKELPNGSTVIEYGCGEGHVSVPLAIKFPNINFVAFDQVAANIAKLEQYPCGKLPNLIGYVAATPKIAAKKLGDQNVDMAICVEVLEHCVEPWKVADGVEAMVKEGGKIIINTPTGPWEPETFAVKNDEYEWRNHIWHFDKDAIRTMFNDKPNFMLSGLSQGSMMYDGRLLSNYYYSYDADHKPHGKLDALIRAYQHNSRQSCAAAIIAYNNEDTMLRMLNSLKRKVQIISIAHGPSTDKTREIVDQWAMDNRSTYVRVENAPAIRAPEKYGGTAPDGEEFGFDHARNRSVECIYDVTDWTLWVDTDEYLSGYFGGYLRNNCLDGYLIPQHHFTVEPRGGETQIDRPARLFRNSVGYKAKGHIHEHFEIPDGGPGHCFMLPNVDIGHTGYVNEETRKQRFGRNYPFLRWEHEEAGDRPLHPFLWFRDIVHRMRYAAVNGEQDMALALAREAEDYFTEKRSFMSNFGAGLPVAMQYIGEARKLLNIGVQMTFTMQFDDRQAEITGLFLDKEEVYGILDDALQEEFRRRQSKYY